MSVCRAKDEGELYRFLRPLVMFMINSYFVCRGLDHFLWSLDVSFLYVEYAIPSFDHWITVFCLYVGPLLWSLNDCLLFVCRAKDKDLLHRFLLLLAMFTITFVFCL